MRHISVGCAHNAGRRQLPHDHFMYRRAAKYCSAGIVPDLLPTATAVDPREALSAQSRSGAAPRRRTSEITAKPAELRSQGPEPLPPSSVVLIATPIATPIATATRGIVQIAGCERRRDAHAPVEPRRRHRPRADRGTFAGYSGALDRMLPISKCARLQAAHGKCVFSRYTVLPAAVQTCLKSTS